MTLPGGILVVNCGSSSIRLGVFETGAARRIWSASVERIGQTDSHLQLSEGPRPPSLLQVKPAAMLSLEELLAVEERGDPNVLRRTSS